MHILFCDFVSSIFVQVLADFPAAITEPAPGGIVIVCPGIDNAVELMVIGYVWIPAVSVSK